MACLGVDLVLQFCRLGGFGKVGERHKGAAQVLVLDLVTCPLGNARGVHAGRLLHGGSVALLLKGIYLLPELSHSFFVAGYFGQRFHGAAHEFERVVCNGLGLRLHDLGLLHVRIGGALERCLLVLVLSRHCLAPGLDLPVHARGFPLPCFLASLRAGAADACESRGVALTGIEQQVDEFCPPGSRLFRSELAQLLLQVIDGLAVGFRLLAEKDGNVKGALEAVIAVCPLNDVLEAEGAAKVAVHREAAYTGVSLPYPQDVSQARAHLGVLDGFDELFDNAELVGREILGERRS